MAFLSLPKHQRDVYDQLGYRDKLEAVDEGIRRCALSCVLRGMAHESQER